MQFSEGVDYCIRTEVMHKSRIMCLKCFISTYLNIKASTATKSSTELHA